MTTNILLEAGTNELELVEFYIKNDSHTGYYGINVAKVVEILPYQKTTTMPQMQHPAIVGIFHHRGGRIVPILDLSVYFGGKSINPQGSKLIITEFNKTITGFIVSGVTRIYRISWEQVEEPDKITQSVEGNCITATVRFENRITFILDLEGIVANLYPALAIHFDGVSNIDFETDRPIRVLHVDDSYIIRQIVSKMMKIERRISLTQAKNGKEAYNMLIAMRDENNIQFDAIITDIEMPHMDGLTLCKKIKDDSILKHIPVAIFSSLVNSELAVKCKSVGADAQYAKPDLKQICNHVIELVSKNSRPQ